MRRARSRIVSALVALATCTLPFAAHAWWDDAYPHRTTVTLNTGAQGLTTTAPLSQMAVPVRLHSGNFDFLAAKPDGSDLRVLAADDKTPLPFSIERFDGAGELAVLWVQLPLVTPGTDQNILHIYAGNTAATAQAPANVIDSGAAATLRFGEADRITRDAGGSGLASTAPHAVEANGLIGASARFDGSQPLELPANDRVRAASGAPYSLSLWARPATSGGTLFAQGPVHLALQNSALQLRVGALTVAGGNLPAAAWAHIGVTLGNGRATLYINGVQAAQGDLPATAPAIDGAIRIGEGYSGQIDELQVATVLRSAEWMAFTRAAQGADALLVATQLQNVGDSTAQDSGSHGYMGILVANLTVDAWVVIGICGVLLLVAIWVMVTKAWLVRRVDGGNASFLKAFRANPRVLEAAGAQAHPGSSLARLYDAGVRQLGERRIGQPGTPPVSGATINAVSAAVNADLVRENQKLNARMVLLTIAISGGPFLGLLGTVVGVMITFAAIAAAGDVNVNAIAPGIAAALLATVAGLGVAIPALFGYNYLASRIKNISADMHIFVEEFVTRVAEQFGAER